MGILVWIVLGAIAGFITNLIMGGTEGVIATIILGIVGAVVGGYLAGTVLKVADVPGDAGSYPLWLSRRSLTTWARRSPASRSPASDLVGAHDRRLSHNGED